MVETPTSPQNYAKARSRSVLITLPTKQSKPRFRSRFHSSNSQGLSLPHVSQSRANIFDLENNHCIADTSNSTKLYARVPLGAHNNANETLETPMLLASPPPNTAKGSLPNAKQNKDIPTRKQTTTGLLKRQTRQKSTPLSCLVPAITPTKEWKPRLCSRLHLPNNQGLSLPRLTQKVDNQVQTRKQPPIKLPKRQSRQKSTPLSRSAPTTTPAK